MPIGKFSPKVSGIQKWRCNEKSPKESCIFSGYFGGWVGFSRVFPLIFWVEIWWNHEGARLTGDQYLTHHLDGCFGTNLEGKGWGKHLMEVRKNRIFGYFLGAGWLGPLEKPYPYSWKKILHVRYLKCLVNHFKFGPTLKKSGGSHEIRSYQKEASLFCIFPQLT